MKTCCFTGHRNIRNKSSDEVRHLINVALDKVIADGVTNFCSGGALNFDQLCAEEVINRRRENNSIRLIFVLPCKNQEKYWTFEQKEFYKKLIHEADEVLYISENYTCECMKLRNQRLVDLADIFICALENVMSGTGQTVRMAKEKGLKVINIL